MGTGKGGGSNAAMSQAALMSAQTGQDYLSFMMQQAGITNQWAAEDRAKFLPLQDQYIATVLDYTSPERQQEAADQAQASAQQQIAAQQAASARQMAAMGVDPDSGRYAATKQSNDIMAGLGAAGAGNMARRDMRAQGDAMLAGLAGQTMVSPSVSMGLSNNAAASGYTGAMSGYGQQANILNQQYQNQYQASSDFWGGVGSIAGLAFMSDEEAKENKRKPGRSLLKAVENMPVEEWDYKAGKGDGGHHVGTYAQDFQKQTGMGDGRSINVIDAIGTTMGAVKELSAKVDRLAGRKGGRSVMMKEAA